VADGVDQPRGAPAAEQRLEAVPSWIELLYKRGHGVRAFFNPLHMGLVHRFVDEKLAVEPGRREELRSCALSALSSDDARTVVQSLAFLMFVGEASDLPRVEPFASSQNDRVREAATTCRFELRRRAKRR